MESAVILKTSEFKKWTYIVLLRKNVSESSDCPLKSENSKISKNSQKSQWKILFEYRTRDIIENKSKWPKWAYKLFTAWRLRHP